MIVKSIKNDSNAVIIGEGVIAPSFSGNNFVRLRVEALNSNIDAVSSVKDSNFGILACRLAYAWILLVKMSGRNSIRPRFFQHPVHLNGLLGKNGRHFSSLSVHMSCPKQCDNQHQKK